MKLLANSSYGYQIKHWSQHTLTKNLSNEKTPSSINSKKFKRLNHFTDQMFEVEPIKREIEHKEPVTVGSFILQYAKLYYIFFKKFCDADRCEEIQMDTDSL